MLRILRTCNTEVNINKEKLGLWPNKKQAVIQGLRRNNYIILIEDDIILSKDALKYFEWADKKFRNNNEVESVTGYSHNCRGDQICKYNNNEGNTIISEKWYTPWSNAIWRHKSHKFLEKWTGRDINYNNYVHLNNKLEVRPLLGRANNIGWKNGTHNTTKNAVWCKIWRGNYYSSDNYKYLPND